MDSKDTPWQEQLIALYLFVCQHYQTTLWAFAQHFSNNDQPQFTDEELRTIYLFGTLKRHHGPRAIYDYTGDHLLEWFPTLPSYGGFIQRLNRLGSAFARLANDLLEGLSQHPRQTSPRPEPSYAPVIGLVDSCAIIMAQHGRSDTARVARQVADKGRCPVKRLSYHGVKLHLIAERRPGSLPLPQDLSRPCCRSVSRARTVASVDHADSAQEGASRVAVDRSCL